MRDMVFWFVCELAVLCVCVCVQVDLMYIQTLYGIRDVHKSGIGEEDFSEVGSTITFHRAVVLSVIEK